MAEPILQIEGLTKRFGGVVASDNIALAVSAGELHAIIGPNGAGKTTLIGQLTGEVTPDAGRIVFGGADITRSPTYRRSLSGLARSFQITSLFQDFTALDNVALATSPRMLLLDEPMAGMGPDESARMVKTLRELKRDLTILLIEHDMEAVFALADRITVLVYGRTIASGTPEAIRANAEVRQAYLGEQEAVDG